MSPLHLHLATRYHRHSICPCLWYWAHHLSGYYTKAPETHTASNPVS